MPPPQRAEECQREKRKQSVTHHAREQSSRVEAAPAVNRERSLLKQGGKPEFKTGLLNHKGYII